MRQLIEEIAQKTASIGPLEMDLNRSGTGHLHSNRKLDIPESYNPPQPHNLFGKLNIDKANNCSGENADVCRICHITVYKRHMGRHLAVHRGERVVDEPSVQGAFFCDLCGLMFRHQANLYKHWRTNCPEIMVFKLYYL